MWSSLICLVMRRPWPSLLIVSIAPLQHVSACTGTVTSLMCSRCKISIQATVRNTTTLPRRLSVHALSICDVFRIHFRRLSKNQQKRLDRTGSETSVMRRSFLLNGAVKSTRYPMCLLFICRVWKGLVTDGECHVVWRSLSGIVTPKWGNNRDLPRQYL